MKGGPLDVLFTPTAFSSLTCFFSVTNMQTKDSGQRSHTQSERKTKQGTGYTSMHSMSTTYTKTFYSPNHSHNSSTKILEEDDESIPKQINNI